MLAIFDLDKINLYQKLNLMFKVKHKAIYTLFIEKFISMNARYPTKDRENNFQVPIQNLKMTDHSISPRGTRL